MWLEKGCSLILWKFWMTTDPQLTRFKFERSAADAVRILLSGYNQLPVMVNTFVLIQTLGSDFESQNSCKIIKQNFFFLWEVITQTRRVHCTLHYIIIKYFSPDWWPSASAASFIDTDETSVCCISHRGAAVNCEIDFPSNSVTFQRPCYVLKALRCGRKKRCVFLFRLLHQ